MHTIWTADATDAATSAATACATAGATAAATSAAATENDTKEVVYSNSEYTILSRASTMKFVAVNKSKRLTSIHTEPFLLQRINGINKITNLRY